MSTVSKGFLIRTIYDGFEGNNGNNGDKLHEESENVIIKSPKKEAIVVKKEAEEAEEAEESGEQENVIVSASPKKSTPVKKKRGRKKKGKSKKPPKKYNSCEICGNDKVSETQTVQCDFCKYKSCKSCLKYYITHNPEPRCMKCDELLSEEFIYLKITKSFLEKEFREHKTKMLFEAHKAKIPSMMPEIAAYKKGEDLGKTKRWKAMMGYLTNNFHYLSVINYLEMHFFIFYCNAHKTMGEFKMKKELTIFGRNKNTVNNYLKKFFPLYEPTKIFDDEEIKQKELEKDNNFSVLKHLRSEKFTFLFFHMNGLKNLLKLFYTSASSFQKISEKESGGIGCPWWSSDGYKLGVEIINECIERLSGKSIYNILIVFTEITQQLRDNTFEKLKIEVENEWNLNLKAASFESICDILNVNIEVSKHISQEDHTKRKARCIFMIWMWEMTTAINKKINSIICGYQNYRDMSPFEIYDNGFKWGSGEKNKTPKKKKINYVSNCPREGCNGLVNEKYTCELCNSVVCKKCFEIIGVKVEGEKLPEHTCDEATLASAKLIKSQTKPCPKCSARIFKISGCDQMWCTNCNVAFDWASGNLIKGRIHNPHYFQWLKNNNEGNTVVRAPEEVVCGGIPEADHLHAKMRNIYFKSACEYYFNNGTDHELIDIFDNWKNMRIWISCYCMSVLRMATHIEDVYVRPLRRRMTIRRENPSKHLYYTTKYVLYQEKEEIKRYDRFGNTYHGNFYKTGLREELYNSYNTTNQIQNNLDIYEMLSAVLNESLREIYNMIPLMKAESSNKTLSLEDFFVLYNRINSVFLYANKELTKTSALKKLSFRDFRFSFIRKGNKTIINSIREWDYLRIPLKRDVINKKNFMDFGDLMDNTILQKYSECMLGKKHKYMNDFTYSLPSGKNKHTHSEPLSLVYLGKEDKYNGTQKSRVELLCKKHVEFYTDRMEKVQQIIKEGNLDGLYQYGYIWTEKLSKPKEVEKLSYRNYGEIPGYFYVETEKKYMYLVENNYYHRFHGPGYYLIGTTHSPNMEKLEKWRKELKELKEKIEKGVEVKKEEENVRPSTPVTPASSEYDPANLLDEQEGGLGDIFDDLLSELESDEDDLLDLFKE